MKIEKFECKKWYKLELSASCCINFNLACFYLGSKNVAAAKNCQFTIWHGCIVCQSKHKICLEPLKCGLSRVFNVFFFIGIYQCVKIQFLILGMPKAVFFRFALPSFWVHACKMLQIEYIISNKYYIRIWMFVHWFFFVVSLPQCMKHFISWPTYFSHFPVCVCISLHRVWFLINV